MECYAADLGTTLAFRTATQTSHFADTADTCVANFVETHLCQAGNYACRIDCKMHEFGCLHTYADFVETCAASCQALENFEIKIVAAFAACCAHLDFRCSPTSLAVLRRSSSRRALVLDSVET